MNPQNLSNHTQEEKICGIYNVNGIKNKSQVKITHISNEKLKPQEYIGDTLLKTFDIFKNVKAEVYKCNITHVFLISSKKLPMLYISVIYERPLRRVLLFKVYVCFDIESEIKADKDLINKPLDGKFSLEISIDSQRKDIDDKMSLFPGEEKVCEKLLNFSTAPEMKELILDLIDEVNEKIKKEYAAEMEYYKPPTNVISLKNYPINDD